VELVDLTPEEIEGIAVRVVTGRVFAVFHVDQMEASFGTLLMLSADGRDMSWLNDVGCIWEDLDKAMGLTVNGAPQFMSAHFVPRSSSEDLQRACIVKFVAVGAIGAEVLATFDAERAADEASGGRHSPETRG
jgi:hypothetical protein